MNKNLQRLAEPGGRLYLIFLVLFAAAALFFKMYELAVAEGVIILILMIYSFFSRRRRAKQLESYIESVTYDTENAKNNTLMNFPLPIAAFRLDDSRIIWGNEMFFAMSGSSGTRLDVRVSDLVPEFNGKWLLEGKTQYPSLLTVNGRKYQIHGNIIRSEDGDDSAFMGITYWVDMTEYDDIRMEYENSRPVACVLVIDNMDELVKNQPDRIKNDIRDAIEDKLNKWCDDNKAIIRRYERDRYLILFESRCLEQLKAEKFSIIQEVHQVESPTGIDASISLGLGVDASSLAEALQYATVAIELALSRGGDQAVIKDRVNFNFYGGRNREADYRSKVRSRVTANSLMELIGQSGRVFIMGHKNADLDAVGAAMGISCLCRKKGKKANIVIDLENNAAEKLIEEIQAVPEYRDVFLSGQDALLMADNRSILVVVDTNRPDQVECRPLLEAISKVCVVDHHRRAADYINPVVVNLHEPYASSAAELVTEVLMYAVEKKDVLPIEAESLMAGICLDTKFFNVRTGERTFEAAAVLRRLGADTTEVKKLMQNDFQDTMAKYQIIKSSRLYRQEIAIAALNTPTTRVLAAQAADELLNISGITASFVLYPDGEQVIISARSIGSANVQMILEPLGGGGNTATAGAQMKDTTVKEALDELVASIDKFYEE